jgi:hypothetical protein
MGRMDDHHHHRTAPSFIFCANISLTLLDHQGQHRMGRMDAEHQHHHPIGLRLHMG